MKEDILNGRYSDPMILDDYAEERVNNFGESVEHLAGNLLKENELKYYRKRKSLQNEDLEEEQTTPYAHGKNRRTVNLKQPWDGDQAMTEWPDYEADAFEKSLEQFRQRPVSNTGYTNKALNDKMIQIYGDRAKKCIDNKLFESKKSATKRRVTESEETLDMAKAYSEAEVFCEVADMFGDDKAAVAKLRSAYKKFKFEAITCSEMLEAMDQYLEIATAHGETSTTAELVQISRLFALHAELNYRDIITHPEAIIENRQAKVALRNRKLKEEFRNDGGAYEELVAALSYLHKAGWTCARLYDKPISYDINDRFRGPRHVEYKQATIRIPDHDGWIEIRYVPGAWVYVIESPDGVVVETEDDSVETLVNVLQQECIRLIDQRKADEDEIEDAVFGNEDHSMDFDDEDSPYFLGGGKGW